MSSEGQHYRFLKRREEHDQIFMLENYSSNNMENILGLGETGN